jgi:hypothetical protein
MEEHPIQSPDILSIVGMYPNVTALEIEYPAALDDLINPRHRSRYVVFLARLKTLDIAVRQQEYAANDQENDEGSACHIDEAATIIMNGN